MTKQQLDHLLRAAGRITGERQFIIIGSQSLHGRHPDLPDAILGSAEADLIARNEAARSEWLNAIGQDSPFHVTFGYYADPVDERTATLPRGWKGRLVHLPPGDTDGVSGLCLDPHDLAIAKYVAARDKDRLFTRQLAQRGIIAEARLRELLALTRVDPEVRTRIEASIEQPELIAKILSHLERTALPPHRPSGAVAYIAISQAGGSAHSAFPSPIPVDTTPRSGSLHRKPTLLDRA